MQASLNTLLDEMLSITQALSIEVQQFNEEDVNGPDKWVDLLEKRQQVIDQISLELQQGGFLTDSHKYRLKELQQIDQQVIPLIVEKKNKIQAQITQINLTKKINQQYNGYGMKTAYGAFFDKKK